MTLRRRVAFPAISLDRGSDKPMYLQLRAALEGAIRGGELPAGSRLPSTRAAARLLGISRNTAVTAYELLAAEDLIASAIGSGTVVLRTRAAARFEDPDGYVLCLHS